MARNTYRVIVIGAAVAVALGLSFSGSLAAHEDCDKDRNDKAAQAGAPIIYADKDRDGRVTKDEASISPALSRNFDRYDLNDDEELDRAEFARLEASSQAAMSSRDREMLDDNDSNEVWQDSSDAVGNWLRPRHVVHPTPQ